MCALLVHIIIATIYILVLWIILYTHPNFSAQSSLMLLVLPKILYTLLWILLSTHFVFPIIIHYLSLQHCIYECDLEYSVQYNFHLTCHWLAVYKIVVFVVCITPPHEQSILKHHIVDLHVISLALETPSYQSLYIHYSAHLHDWFYHNSIIMASRKLVASN